MRPTERPEIRRLPLFRNMLQANFDALMQGAYAQAFPAGLELIRQGDPADILHVIMEGSVELYASWGGRDCTLAVVRPVGTFFLAACIRDAPYLMSARTIERSRIVLVPASDLRAAFRRDSEFAVSVIDELAGCYRAVVRPRGLIDEPEHSRDLTEAAQALREAQRSRREADEDPATTLIDFR